MKVSEEHMVTVSVMKSVCDCLNTHNRSGVKQHPCISTNNVNTVSFKTSYISPVHFVLIVHECNMSHIRFCVRYLCNIFEKLKKLWNFSSLLWINVLAKLHALYTNSFLLIVGYSLLKFCVSIIWSYDCRRLSNWIGYASVLTLTE